jgi:hypothetical protein
MMPHFTVELSGRVFLAALATALVVGFVVGWIVMDDAAGHAAFWRGFRAAFGYS